MNLATVVFTSTRQHYGLNDVDIISIGDTLSKSKIVRDSLKIVHIKTIPGEEKIASQKKEWFNKNGFIVLETIGNWKNDHTSHGQGLIGDMSNVYNAKIFHEYKIDKILHLENDWVYLDKIDECIARNINLLEENRNIIYVRDTRVDQPDINKRLPTLGGAGPFVITNKEFSFNPFVARYHQIRAIANLVKSVQLHPHCEMAYEIAASILYPDNYYAYNHNGLVKHIGSPGEYNEYTSR